MKKAKFNPTMIYATASIFLLSGCDVSDNGSHSRGQSMSRDQVINNMQHEFSDHCGIKIFDIKKDIFASGNNQIRDVKIIDEDCNIELTYFKEGTTTKTKEVLSLKDFTALLAESEERKREILSSNTDQNADSGGGSNILSGLLVGYLLSNAMQRSSMMNSYHNKFSRDSKKRHQTSALIPFFVPGGRASTGYASNVKTSILNKSSTGRFSVGKPISLSTRSGAFSGSSFGGRASSYGG